MKVKSPFVRSLAAALMLGACLLTPQASIVDDFNDNVKTGWRDFSFGIGGSTEVGGQLKFSIPAAGQPVFAASTKTTDTYTLADGKTIEFRVDLVSGNSKDSFAILSWTPKSQSVSSLAGYSIAKSPTDILITKGINKYFHNENPTPAIKNDNVTLVLILTQKGTDVYITGKILDKDANNAVIFERTYVDTAAADVLRNGTDSPAAPWTGDGEFTLIEYEDYDPADPSPYEVVFDNAEAFKLENAVVDNFDDNVKTAWQDFTFGLGSSTEANGQFTFSIPPAGQPIFFASTKTSRTYEFKDGEKIEFRVDLVTGNSKDSFAILAWIPTSQNVSSLAGYSLAKSPTDILISKGINKYFHNENPTPAIKNDNVTLGLTLERRGTSVVINGRVYDKDADNAVIFDATYVDTIAADVLRSGTDSPAAPWTGPGNFVLLEYEDYDPADPTPFIVTYDNAWAASPPLPANLPPSIGDITPENYRNFIAPASGISFKVTDDKAVPAANINVTLNGTKITSANGLNLATAGTTTTATLGGLQANVNYTAVIEATDADGAVVRQTIYFDTFDKNSLTVEVEDYNFDGGSFIDNPAVIPLGDFESTGYRSQAGVPDTDYSSTNTRTGGEYRPDDTTTQRPTLDFKRDAYLPDGNVDYDLARIRTGEWQRYTRTFPAGNFQIYLRESFFNVPTGETVLEKVNGLASDPDAPVEVLGSFLGFNSGALFRNVPLTDASGTPVTVQLDGVTTLRLRQVTADPSDGDIFQNYFVFIPVGGTAVNRPRAISLLPPANAIYETTDLHLGATLQDRDTTVNASSIELYVNSAKVTPTITNPSPGLTTVDYHVTPLPPSESAFNVSLRFADSTGARITNNWSFIISYRSVDPANRVPAAGSAGFNVRVVQAPAGSALANSLSRAEDQLSANSTIPKAYDLTTTGDFINYNQIDGGNDGFFGNDILIPGLDSPDAQGTDDIAMEATAYLALPAGVVTFGVRSDDGFKLSAGHALHDQTPVLDFHNGGPADQTFDVVVPAAGLYPVRLLWYERGGGAFVEFYTLNRSTGDRTLVNDPNAANAIKAYRELVETFQVSVSGQTANSLTLSWTGGTGKFLIQKKTDIGAATWTNVMTTTDHSATVPRDGTAGFFRVQSDYQGPDVP
jgi:hypothetical protein